MRGMDFIAIDTRRNFHLWLQLQRWGVDRHLVIPVLLLALVVPAEPGEPLRPLYLALTVGWYLVWERLVGRLTLKRLAWLYLPATFLHEMAHAFAALLQGGRAWVSLTPKVLPDGRVHMGSVVFEGVYSRSLVGLAPLALWPLAMVLMERVLLAGDIGWRDLGLWFLSVQMVHAALMISEEDLALVPLLLRLIVGMYCAIYVVHLAFWLLTRIADHFPVF